MSINKVGIASLFWGSLAQWSRKLLGAISAAAGWSRPAVGAYLAKAAVGRSTGESGRFSPPFAAGQESSKLGNVTSKIRRQRFEEDEIKAVALSRTMRFK